MNSTGALLSISKVAVLRSYKFEVSIGVVRSNIVPSVLLGNRGCECPIMEQDDSPAVCL